GRVEDNDIVIEHRSVSRNHAKILFDGRTHKIIDLQSANGILVNGEEYAMTDLRKGDLIELGHVRFRFVPADEPFRPTAEEAQEMQAAGVASPLSESDDPDEPLDAAARPVTADLPNQYDASQAQTVTDAPLNALEPSVPNPVVEPAASAPVSSPLTAPLTAPIPGRPLPQNDERPTELNRAPTAIPVPAPAVESNVPSYRAPTAIDPPMPPRRPKRRFGMFFAVLLLAAAVFATVVVLFEFIGPANDPDTRLARLFNEERYAEVVALYERNPNAFSEPDQAEGYYRAAGSLSAEAAMPLEVEDPDNGFELDPSDMEPDAVDVELPPDASSPTTPEPPIAEPTPPDQAEPDEATSDEAAALAARRRRRAEAARRAKQRTNQIRRLISQARQQIIQGKLDLAAKTLKECLRLDPRQQSCHQLQVRRLGALGDKQILSGDLVAASKTVKESLRLYPKQSGTRLIQLKFLVELGKRQLIEGKFESAEATLKQCLKLNPRQPACHRNLGVLFARQDQTTSAIRHYRRYIELQPDANDAPRVREILKKFEGSP
ncbi:MAG: tetratricopeptide repeat protein, partial [Myxococcota bacterium]